MYINGVIENKTFCYAGFELESGHATTSPVLHLDAVNQKALVIAKVALSCISNTWAPGKRPKIFSSDSILSDGSKVMAAANHWLDQIDAWDDFLPEGEKPLMRTIVAQTTTNFLEINHSRRTNATRKSSCSEISISERFHLGYSFEVSVESWLRVSR